MFRATEIQLETAKQISPHQELAIIRAAFARNPSPLIRERLAGLLTLADAFDEIVETLSSAPDRSFLEDAMLVQAHLARDTVADTQQAHKVADAATRTAVNDAQRAAALAARGKAEARLGDIETARATFLEALSLDPTNKDACKRIVALELAHGTPSDLLVLLEVLAKKGAAHTRLYAGRALALARSGRFSEAREAIGFDQFHHLKELSPPRGWTSISDFNAALADELLAHPALRYERYGTASELTWRIDAPATGEAPLVRLLLDRLSSEIAAHLEHLGRSDHPWLRARPNSALLRSWCVITDGDGYETWHVHHFGWLSGVYYVRVPEAISEGAGTAGCLAFGLPPDLAGQEAAEAYGSHLVRPREGLMLAFPSHSYHRTFPHGTGERRICLAFDLRSL